MNKYDVLNFFAFQRINLALSTSAALAIRLLQINLEIGGGELPPGTSIFTPFTYRKLLFVPTLPSIKFTYKIDQSMKLYGLYDMFLFALNADITRDNDLDLMTLDFKDIFYQTAFFRYPQILPWHVANMNWPGDGMGPLTAQCLASSCDAGRSFSNIPSNAS